MPDAGGNIKGIALTGKAGETLERIKAQRRECGQEPKTCKWGDACADCLDECTIDRESKG